MRVLNAISGYNVVLGITFNSEVINLEIQRILIPTFVLMNEKAGFSRRLGRECLAVLRS